MSTTLPSYFPPGWDKEKLLDASSDDLLELPDHERIAMFDGLKAALGPEGFQTLLYEISTRYKARLAAAEAGHPQPEDELPPELRAPFLATLQRIYLRGKWGEWGFVVFRTTFGEDEKWASLRQRWDEIVEERLSDYGGVMGVDEAKRLLRFHWVDQDPALDAAPAVTVAARYRTMTNLAPGLSHSLCLSITPAAMASVLDSPLSSSAPRNDRQKIPFAVAVDRDAGVVAMQPCGYSGHFNVAVESLVDELFPVIGIAATDPRTLSQGLQGDDIWCSAGRFGIHRAS